MYLPCMVCLFFLTSYRVDYVFYCIYCGYASSESVLSLRQVSRCLYITQQSRFGGLLQLSFPAVSSMQNPSNQLVRKCVPIGQPVREALLAHYGRPKILQPMEERVRSYVGQSESRCILIGQIIREAVLYRWLAVSFGRKRRKKRRGFIIGCRKSSYLTDISRTLRRME